MEGLLSETGGNACRRCCFVLRFILATGANDRHLEIEAFYSDIIHSEEYLYTQSVLHTNGKDFKMS